MSRLYILPIGGLKDGNHNFDFEIGNRFFENFEESEITEGDLVANLSVEKRSTHIDLLIRIEGFVKISCTRCLGIFRWPVKSESRLLVKFGDTGEEIDPDIIYLPHGENELDLEQHLYEDILLALPIRRIHPDDSEGNSTCDPLMLRKLEDLKTGDEPGDDPRWNDLKKLLNNN
ncbi:MAG TPA: DUF177 domain-containing protein [Bacteroidales bacterium]|nr:DUF177 domain-containing protein [Bacteroidales bacterium]